MAVLLKSLQADNVFSYKNLYVEFDNANITQILAPNGYGKTNIINALLEGLYGNNPRGYKKGDIPNSLTGSNNYYIKVNFEVEGVPYSVITDRRGAKLNLTLESEGHDLSSHTSKDTYKEIQELLGIDYSLACSLIYQSATTSMEFLSATDAARKKYLLNLLSLESYSNNLETIKSALKSEEENLKKILATKATILGKIEVVESILSNLVEKPYSEEEEAELVTSKEFFEQELKNIKARNDLIDSQYQVRLNLFLEESKKYNELKAKYESALSIADSKLHALAPISEDIYTNEQLSAWQEESEAISLEVHTLSLEVAKATTEVAILTTKYNSLKASMPKTKCHVCHSDLGTESALVIHEEEMSDIQGRIRAFDKYLCDTNPYISSRKTALAKLKSNISEADTFRRGLDKAKANNLLIVEMNNRLQKEIDSAKDYLSSNACPRAPAKPISIVREDSSTIIEALAKVTKNLAIMAANKEHNEAAFTKRANALLEKANLYSEALSTDSTIFELEDKCEKLRLLADVVKNTITFVIESSVGSLQELTNHYLQAFTGGQFQIQFKIDNDKLNVVLYKDGKEMSFYMASAGQAARISTATLLAIRNLLDTVSRNKINFLMLDEVLGVLDAEGKEALFEVLSKEEDMNIFLVSHEYSHPLFAKLELKKDAQGCTYIEEA